MKRIISLLLVSVTILGLFSCSKQDQKDEISIDIVGKWIIKYSDTSYLEYDFKDDTHLTITTCDNGSSVEKNYLYRLSEEEDSMFKEKFVWIIRTREIDSQEIRYCIIDYKDNSMGLTSHPYFGSDYYPLERE